MKRKGKKEKRRKKETEEKKLEYWVYLTRLSIVRKQ